MVSQPAHVEQRLSRPNAEYQKSIAEIEQMTGLDFGKLIQADTLGGSKR
jgi:hypothetical protein